MKRPQIVDSGNPLSIGEEGDRSHIDTPPGDARMAPCNGQAGDAGPHIAYLARCGDGSLYAGYTTHLARRIAMHNAGTGARYTRGRGPVSAIAAWSFAEKGDALRAEIALKRLSHRAKLALAQGFTLGQGEDDDSYS